MYDRGHFLGVSGDREEVDPPRDSRSLSDSKEEPANSSSDSATKMNVRVTILFNNSQQFEINKTTWKKY